MVQVQVNRANLYLKQKNDYYGKEINMVYVQVIVIIRILIGVDKKSNYFEESI